MDAMFSKKKTPKQTGLFGKSVKEGKPDDEEMQIIEKAPEQPKFIPWVEK